MELYIKLNCFGLIALSTLAFSASTPSTPVNINNDTACTFTLHALSNRTSMLSLPKTIGPYSLSQGHIEFSGSIFSTNNQSSKGEYLALCPNSKHALTLKFYIGQVPHTNEYDYFFDMEPSTNPLPPFLLLPSSQQFIRNHSPVNIRFIDQNSPDITIKEPPSDEEDQDTGQDSAH
ncbi:hypothetical protein [Candidatus Synchoanobacter obligatus]|uniref:Uncharacterized protein n=1 Tax=Candidatus Synchoanobacter obligatus TaxID=2919597 RepID=A0ABT1L4Y8_9GAMM|nr:hypothetical protein [Candidatus Synchoanobacter obligatus]MCP8352159.1 hypothetical protein [Candidatus Synchoanobacter obligatus]